MARVNVLVPRENPRRRRRASTRRKRRLPRGVTRGPGGRFKSSRRSRAARKSSRRRRRRNPTLAAVANPRRSRKKMARRRSRTKRVYRRTRRAASRAGRGSKKFVFKLLPPMFDTMFVFTGALISKALPRLAIPEHDDKIKGYALNLGAGALGAAMLGKLVNRRAGVMALVGTGSAILWRVAWDYGLLSPFGLQGPESMGYITPAGFSGMVDSNVSGYIDSPGNTAYFPSELAEGSMGGYDDYSFTALPY